MVIAASGRVIGGRVIKHLTHVLGVTRHGVVFITITISAAVCVITLATSVTYMIGAVHNSPSRRCSKSGRVGARGRDHLRGASIRFSERGMMWGHRFTVLICTAMLAVMPADTLW